MPESPVNFIEIRMSPSEIGQLFRDVPADKHGDMRGVHKIEEKAMRLRYEGESSYPGALPGNKIGTEIKHSMSPQFHIVYRMVRGRNINTSYRRMVEGSTDPDDVKDIVNNFKIIRSTEPSEAVYKDLIRAYCEYYDIGFVIEEEERGTILKIWENSGERANEQWNLLMRRGEHRYYESYDVDLSKIFGVPDDEFLTMSKYLHAGGRGIKSVRRDIK